MSAKQKCEGVVLTIGPKSGYGFDKKRGKWFVKYNNLGKPERTYINATTPEEAIKERDVIFTAMILSGATRKGEATRGPRKRVLRDRLDPDYGIKAMTITVTRFKVIVNKKYLGTRRTKAAARDLRDAYLEANALKPCATCGRFPIFTQEKNTQWGFRHAEPDCLNLVKIRRIGKVEATKKWNTELYKQKPFEI